MPSTESGRQRWLIAASLVLALALTVMPLPQFLQVARPDWMALVIAYWAIFAPTRIPLWLITLAGLCLDTMYGTPLGLHALALLIMSYPALKWHLRLRVFSWAQLAATIAGLVLLYEFVLLWANGVTQLSMRGIDYWLPIVTSAIAWPLVLYILDAVVARDDT
ncbi:MAG: rod shape-determining protein MreD [Pseudomonadota bacterium]